MIAKSKRPKAGGKRDRVPSLAELATLWKGAEGLPHDVWRDYARAVFALPARRNEVAAMGWRDIDLDGAKWTLPAKLTKTNEAHALHLHPLILDLLRARHIAMGRPKDGIVFPAPRTGERIVAFSALKRAIDRLAPEIPGWSWHDCRRSFASALGETGVAEPVADAILNHRQAASRPGVIGIYQKSRRMPEQIAAMQTWGRLLEAAINGETVPANVVSLHG